jgi:thiosulfate reductase cytochrome b subunit
MTVKPRTNFYLDAVLFILMLIVLISGLVLWIGIPSGGDGAGGQRQGRRWQDAGTVYDQAEGESGDLGQSQASSGSDRSLIFSRQDWKTIHVWLGLVVGGALLVHLVFHWKWITCRVRVDVLGQRSNRRSSSAGCPE